MADLLDFFWGEAGFVAGDVSEFGGRVAERLLGVPGIVVWVGVDHSGFPVGVHGVPGHGFEGGDWLWRGRWLVREIVVVGARGVCVFDVCWGGGGEDVFDGAVYCVEDGGWRLEGRVAYAGVAYVVRLAGGHVAAKGRQYHNAGVNPIQFPSSCLKNSVISYVRPVCNWVNVAKRGSSVPSMGKRNFLLSRLDWFYK